MGRVLFRCDASSSLGTGHIVRCAALADVLKARGHDTLFLCRTRPGDAGEWLKARGHRIRLLPCSPDENEVRDTADALADEARFDWLIIDHYGLDIGIERALRRHTDKILVIDDAALRAHDADLLLDQNADAQAERYVPLLPPHSRLLIGGHYALLRREFGAARKQRRKRGGDIRRILVCFGGSDPANHTLATIAALRPHLNRLDRIDLVIGSANPHAAQIIDDIGDDPRWHIFHPAESIVDLMREADLSVGAGGTMNWERACLGLPSLAFGIVANQRHGLTRLIEDGLVLGDPDMLRPDPIRISAWLDILLSTPALAHGIGQRSAHLVDGRGCDRVADELFPADFTFRPAAPGDCRDLHLWRNHSAIRALSSDPAEISWESHKAWFLATLQHPDRCLVIAEVDRQPAGVVRFDINGTHAIISVYRIPDAPRRGYRLIDAATRWFSAQRPDIESVHANVLAANTPSQQAFLAAGYHLDRQSFLHRYFRHD